jgi:RNA-directed DNA polymerase
MGSLTLQASSGWASRDWHRSNGGACHGRVRSRQRRIVQAVQTGAGRKVKRLRSRWGHSLAARAFAVTRVTEHTGKKTPGVDGDLWATPAENAHAVARIGRWRGSRPAPLKRLSLPKKNGPQRPLSLPTLTDRARQAVSLQALQPRAETTAAHDSDGVRPKRRCAEAIDPCFKILRQQSSAAWIVAGAIHGCFGAPGQAWRVQRVRVPPRQGERAAPPGIEAWAHGGNARG